MKTILAVIAVACLALAPGQAALAQTASQSTDNLAGDSAMELAKKDRQKYLEQGFHMTQKLEFNVDANTGTAGLVGKGSADLDSHLSFVDPGGGAFLEVYFMSPGDPVFIKSTSCRRVTQCSCGARNVLMRTCRWGRGCPCSVTARTRPAKRLVIRLSSSWGH